jgi:hypothetical protein
VAPTAAYGPTASPDRVVLTWDDNPATTQAVTWRTDISIKLGLAEVAKKVRNIYFPELA